MQKFTLSNGLRVLYKKGVSKLTSISIGINAGAAVENEVLGVAHATEHMVYKGTKNRSEKQINEDLSRVFGFQNAMTNYPYVIYYGTLLGEDFKEGVEIFSDIIMNPTFKEDGFKEEMNVIKEELKEWDEELEQFCEDKLFLNSFENRRIKYPIIGEENSLNSMTLEDIKSFYNKNYFPSNTSVGVISDLSPEEVLKVIEKCFGKWENKGVYSYKESYENPKEECFEQSREGANTCKVQLIFPIHELSNREMKALRIFNEYFGEGVNSLLYDNLRTQHGLIYDVICRVAYEGNIKLYKITYSTSSENLEKSIEIVRECIIKGLEIDFSESEISQLSKTLKLKRLFREEQSIIIAKELSTYDVMFGDGTLYFEEVEGLNEITSSDIKAVANKVLKKYSMQVIKGR
ncbi:MAG: M16 family metallopeptidase [Clostridium sp.]